MHYRLFTVYHSLIPHHLRRPLMSFFHFLSRRLVLHDYPLPFSPTLIGFYLADHLQIAVFHAF